MTTNHSWPGTRQEDKGGTVWVALPSTKFCLPKAKNLMFAGFKYLFSGSLQLLKLFGSFENYWGEIFIPLLHPAPFLRRQIAPLSSLFVKSRAKKCFEALTRRDPKLFHKISPGQVIQQLILGCQYLHCWEWEKCSGISAELPGNSRPCARPANPCDGNRNILVALNICRGVEGIFFPFIHDFPIPKLLIFGLNVCHVEHPAVRANHPHLFVSGGI